MKKNTESVHFLGLMIPYKKTESAHLFGLVNSETKLWLSYVTEDKSLSRISTAPIWVVP